MRKVTNGVLVAILLTVALVVGVNAQAVATNFNWVVTKLLTVTDVATFTSSMSVAGAANLAGNLIQDTSGQILSGDLTLAQWDTATFVFYGTSWIQIDESNN